MEQALLPRHDRHAIDRLIPLHQAKVHIAFLCDVVVGSQAYPKGACALTEHLIVLCKPAFLFGRFSLLKRIHLLDINGFTTSSETECTITTPDAQVTITAPEVLRFSRFLIRNYYVITIMFPPGMRFQFTPHDKALFPPLDPGISPTQIFQFSYNANCSYYEASYEHDVARFMHSQLLTGNGIIDLTLLPLNLMEVTFNEPLELRPLFTSMMFYPFVYGIVCHGVARPDIARAIAPLIIANPNMHIVDLHDCGIESGLAELSDAMQYGKTSHVSFWDLSDNPILDMSAFCVGLLRTCADIFYLNLNGTNISGDSTKLLFRALCMNKHFCGLSYLCVAFGMSLCL
jgi:hypothetical protein